MILSPKFLRRSALAMLVVGASLLSAQTSESQTNLPAKGETRVEVLPIKGSGSPKIVMTGIMELPPKKVWAIVSDCSTYKIHLPRVAASRLVKKDGNTHTCEVTIEMPFPLSNLTAITNAVHEENDKGMSPRWKLVSGDYNFNEGSWEVKPLNDGASSLVIYTVHAEPKSNVPDWIREKAQKKALPELFERVRTEAAKVP